MKRSYGCSRSVTTGRKSRRSSLPGVVPWKVPERILASSRARLVESAAKVAKAVSRRAANAASGAWNLFMMPPVRWRARSVPRRARTPGPARSRKALQERELACRRSRPVPRAARRASPPGDGSSRVRDGPEAGQGPLHRLLERLLEGELLVVEPPVIGPGYGGFRPELRQGSPRSIPGDDVELGGGLPDLLVLTDLEPVHLDGNLGRVLLHPLATGKRPDDRFTDRSQDLLRVPPVRSLIRK